MIRALPIERLCGLLTDAGGLTQAQAAQQRERFGRNDIAEASAHPALALLRDTARDPMIWFLVGTGLLYGALGETTEAATLLVAVVPLIGMDLVLHWRTQASTAGLRSHLASTAVVSRDGVQVTVPAADVVPGDLAYVEAGDTFPADGVLVGGRELQVEEAALTGESYPVRKRLLAAIPAGNSRVDVDTARWGLAGTRLLTGRATLRVVYTGGETLYGEIVRSARGGHERTPLQAAIARLVAGGIAAAAAVCVVLAVVRIRQGHGWVDALVSAATLAVAALPEEFPMVFTFFLGLGVFRLAKRRALVRRAVSVENVGRISCICTDKTGTITEGRLRLTHVVPADGVAETGLLELAALASRPHSHEPLDTAILEVAATRSLSRSFELLDRFPFSEDTRRETAIVRDGAGHRVLAITKGSIEVILAMTRADEAGRAEWTRRADALAREGHKVIACAWQDLDHQHRMGEPRHGYQVAGLLAFEDPVRENVVEAIAVCRRAGIRTIMVTGDHPLTARAVAGEIGLGGSTPHVVTAADMEQHPGGAFLESVDVIARAAPTQKLGLVRALQSRGEIVAVTGDGVNDVPALRVADVGIAMGQRGTSSAREIASIVLLDDNFSTIVRAVAEGRQLFRNLQLSFAYLLMIHIPLVITAALIPLAGYPVLYMPIHIVWLELIIHPTALLTFPDLPASAPLAPAVRQRVTRFFSVAEWLRIVLVGATLTIIVAAGYERSLGAGRDVEHARAMAMALLTTSSALLAAGLSRLRTWTARAVSAATLAVAVALIQISPASRLLHMRPLHIDDWALVLAAAALVAVPVFLRAGRVTTRPAMSAPVPLRGA